MPFIPDPEPDKNMWDFMKVAVNLPPLCPVCGYESMPSLLETRRLSDQATWVQIHTCFHNHKWSTPWPAPAPVAKPWPAPAPVAKPEPSILHDAEQATVHTRREEYGHPFDDFSQIAAEWSQELGITLTPEQVGRMMIRLKLVRLKHNPKHRDSIVDIAGYANCLDMIRQRREQGTPEKAPEATKVTTYPPEDIR